MNHSPWTFLSNHSHVLICLARNTETRIRDIALDVQITERAVQRILSDLEEAGVIRKHKKGRRNVYFIDPDVHLRHPIEKHCSIEQLLSFVLSRDDLNKAMVKPDE